MTGHAMPWNKEPSGQQKEDAKNARELQKKQKDLADQQEREINERRKKLTAQQISMLRSRFGVSGGVSSSASATSSGGPSDTLQTPSDTAGSLFARITGN
jgi:hypothetical protein